MQEQESKIAREQGQESKGKIAGAREQDHESKTKRATAREQEQERKKKDSRSDPGKSTQVKS